MNLPTTAARDVAIAIAEANMREGGHAQGPCLDCRPTGSPETALWEVELAYVGEMGRSETTDPPSIVLQVNLTTKQVQLIDLM